MRLEFVPKSVLILLFFCVPLNLAPAEDSPLAGVSQRHQSESTQWKSSPVKSSPAASGGASIANYDELIGLIENVVDAEWVAQGGTASAIPYRQGVRIDPQGLVERIDASQSAKWSLKVLREGNNTLDKQILSLKELGDWQEPNALRWVSLHQLDEQIHSRATDEKNKRANVAMELLGGLVRIDYLAFDKTTQEWFVGGPAGNIVLNAAGELLNPETGLPPVLLEDLLAIAPHVLGNRGELGCSIDPDPKRLAEANKMAQSTASARLMQQDPERWAEQWRQKLGRQRANVVGLNPDSPTGFAMLIADSHMKRIGLGLEFCPSPIKTYWDERDTFVTNSDATGMVRWWFSTTNHKIPYDPDRKIFHFSASNVQVLSQAQMMSEVGERVAASAPDRAADSFAKSFSRNFERLQREYRVYGRLRHIFDLAVAMEIVRNEMKLGFGKPFLSLDDLQVQPRLPVAPTELESISATHRTAKGTTSSMISGGVSIQLSGLGKRLEHDKTQTNRVSLEASNHFSKPSEQATDANPVSSATDLTPASKGDKPFWR